MNALVVIIAGVIDSIFFSLWSRMDQESERQPLDQAQKVTNFLSSFIGSLWMSYGMFILLKHVKPNGVVELVSVPIGCWLMIILTIAVKEQIKKNKSISKAFSTHFKYLVSLIIISLIVGKY